MFNNASSPHINNCTFSLNTATSSGAGLYNMNVSSAIATNSILWGDLRAGLPEEIVNVSGSSAAVTYCDVQLDAGFYPGTGNINANPMLTVGFALQAGSPCIDAGNNAAVPTGVTTDFNRGLRIFDGNGDEIATVDIGADEFSP